MIWSRIAAPGLLSTNREDDEGWWEGVGLDKEGWWEGAGLDEGWWEKAGLDKVRFDEGWKLEDGGEVREEPIATEEDGLFSTILQEVHITGFSSRNFQNLRAPTLVLLNNGAEFKAHSIGRA